LRLEGALPLPPHNNIELQWYRRLAEVPRIGYSSSPDVQRTKLRGWNASARVVTYGLDGEDRASLWWATPGGETTQAPTIAWADPFNTKGRNAAENLQRVREALELAGTVADYHLVLMGAARALWPQLAEAPWVPVELEQICKLDLQLVQAYPGAVRDIAPNLRNRYYPDSTFGILITLYEQEGYLHEALAVARETALIVQQPEALASLERRVESLEAEDAD
jgi:hypothetical protein